jgi:hypothetical protein
MEEAPPPFVRNVVPGRWVLSGAEHLMSKLAALPATMTTERDEIFLDFVPGTDEVLAARIAVGLRDLGIAFSDGKDWSPVAYLTHLKKQHLLDGDFTEIYWTASQRWKLRAV